MLAMSFSDSENIVEKSNQNSEEVTELAQFFFQFVFCRRNLLLNAGTSLIIQPKLNKTNGESADLRTHVH